MKKLLCFALGAALLVPLLSACGGEKWDISMNRDGSVTAYISDRDGKRTLIVEGDGEMKNFKYGTTPWYTERDTIEAVEVKSGVKSIGSNSFKGISVPYILFPESVERVGGGAANQGVKLFAENGAATFEPSVDLYYYSETAPLSTDVYWQSDKTTGNITDGLHSAQKRYFHYEGEEPTAWDFYKVLFIGNSFTYRNGISEPSGGVAKLFDSIAENLGAFCETYMIAGPGWHLKEHANPDDDCGRQVSLLLDAVNDFDYIVLQEHSTDSIDKNADFVDGIKALQQKIAETQTRATVVLYETWGSPASAKARSTTVSAMEAELKDVYEAAAEECGISTVSYVGKAFTAVYETYPNDKNYYLWDTDDRHQGYLGAYLSACVHVGTLLELHPFLCTFEAETGVTAPPMGVLQTLRETAEEVAFGG